MIGKAKVKKICAEKRAEKAFDCEKFQKKFTIRTEKRFDTARKTWYYNLS